MGLPPISLDHYKARDDLVTYMTVLACSRRSRKSALTQRYDDHSGIVVKRLTSQTPAEITTSHVRELCQQANCRPHIAQAPVLAQSSRSIVTYRGQAARCDGRADGSCR